MLVASLIVSEQNQIYVARLAEEVAELEKQLERERLFVTELALENAETICTDCGHANKHHCPDCSDCACGAFASDAEVYASMVEVIEVATKIADDATDRDYADLYDVEGGLIRKLRQAIQDAQDIKEIVSDAHKGGD